MTTLVDKWDLEDDVGTYVHQVMSFGLAASSQNYDYTNEILVDGIPELETISKSEDDKKFDLDKVEQLWEDLFKGLNNNDKEITYTVSEDLPNMYTWLCDYDNDEPGA